MSHSHSDVKSDIPSGIKSPEPSDTIFLSHIELKLREGCITRHVNTLLKEINSSTFTTKCMDKLKNGYNYHTFNLDAGCKLVDLDSDKVLQLVNKGLQDKNIKLDKSDSYFYNWTVHFIKP